MIAISSQIRDLREERPASPEPFSMQTNSTKHPQSLLKPSVIANFAKLREDCETAKRTPLMFSGACRLATEMH
jgi:hypothetical protein